MVVGGVGMMVVMVFAYFPTWPTGKTTLISAVQMQMPDTDGTVRVDVMVRVKRTGSGVGAIAVLDSSVFKVGL